MWWWVVISSYTQAPLSQYVGEVSWAVGWVGLVGFWRRRFSRGNWWKRKGWPPPCNRIVRSRLALLNTAISSVIALIPLISTFFFGLFSPNSLYLRFIGENFTFFFGQCNRSFAIGPREIWTKTRFKFPNRLWRENSDTFLIFQWLLSNS